MTDQTPVGVHRFLVTARDDSRIDLWSNTAAYANWLGGREHPSGGQTWLVTVFAEHGQLFLDAAAALGVTVEELDGAGDNEEYVLRTGEPGTGWAPPA